MCSYNFVLQSVAYCSRVTVTLTSGLSSRKIVSGLYLLFEVGIPNLGVWIHFGVPECHILFWGHTVT